MKQLERSAFNGLKFGNNLYQLYFQASNDNLTAKSAMDILDGLERILSKCTAADDGRIIEYSAHIVDNVGREEYYDDSPRSESGGWSVQLNKGTVFNYSQLQQRPKGYPIVRASDGFFVNVIVKGTPNPNSKLVITEVYRGRSTIAVNVLPEKPKEIEYTPLHIAVRQAGLYCGLLNRMSEQMTPYIDGTLQKNSNAVVALLERTNVIVEYATSLNVSNLANPLFCSDNLVNAIKKCADFRGKLTQKYGLQ